MPLRKLFLGSLMSLVALILILAFIPWSEQSPGAAESMDDSSEGGCTVIMAVSYTHLTLPTKRIV